MEPEGRVPEGLLRLSVGLEHVDDLWDDLDAGDRGRNGPRGAQIAITSSVPARRARAAR